MTSRYLPITIDRMVTAAWVTSEPPIRVPMLPGAVLVPVRHRSAVVAYAVIDDADLPRVAEWSWVIEKGGYAVAGQNHKMHRMVAGARPGDGLYVDHINGDRLDNRRSNLRLVTPAQSAQNRASRPGSSSKYRCVTKLPNNKWQVQTELAGTVYHLGSYDSEDEAGEVARRWRAEHMPFANLDRE